MWRNRSILLCRAGTTKDGNVDRLGRDILDGFRAVGWTASDVVLPGENPGPALGQIAGRIASGAFDLILSVQDMGLFGGADVDAIMTRGGARRLYWALDHPYSCWSSVAKLPANAILLYPTRSNVECCRRHLRSDLTPYCIPHGAARREAKPWAERSIGALFVGNAPKQPPDHIRRAWPHSYPPLWARVLETMAERFEPNGTPTLEGLAEMALGENGQDPASVKTGDFMLLLAVFDAYAWAVVRVAYVSALRDLPVTLIGQGWEAFAGDAMRLQGPLPTNEARLAMADAKLILNFQSPWFRSHERIFEGMAAGCAVAAVGGGVLANTSGQADDPADDAAIAYLGPPRDAGARVSALLDSDARLQTLAESGRADQRQRHGWDDRVKSLLDHVERAG
jgi:hypothetical protein